ncbi:MAG: hypothetical protein NTY66_00300 [Candidatus Vogelbacteria bacterium]|nr:hypothetical protein [Candidatus Vogelbacteria bacterium]
MSVTILDKPEGQTWTQREVSAIVDLMVEVEQLPRLPHRLALMNKPLRGKLEDVVSTTAFTSREVDYHDRWK